MGLLLCRRTCAKYARYLASDPRAANHLKAKFPNYTSAPVTFPDTKWNCKYQYYHLLVFGYVEWVNFCRRRGLLGIATPKMSEVQAACNPQSECCGSFFFELGADSDLTAQGTRGMNRYDARIPVKTFVIDSPNTIRAHASDDARKRGSCFASEAELAATHRPIL